MIVLLAAVGIVGGPWLVTRWLVERDAGAARRAVDSGRLDDASAALERWLSSAPRSGEAHYVKARIAWARGDLGTVHQEIERARVAGLSPQAELDRLWGLLLVRTNQTAKAEPFLRRAFDDRVGPDPEVAEALVRIYLGSFRLADAGTVLDRWAHDVPQDARPYLLRTEVQMRTGEAADVVIASYREALQRDPDLDQARLGLADMLRSIHRNAEAADEYARYTARKPDDPLGYLGAGQNALEAGDEVEATRRLDQALALAPRDTVVLEARAAVDVRARRFKSALEYIDRAVKVDPFDRANRYQRMLVLTQLGRKADADAERQAIDKLRKDRAEFDRISRELVKSPLDAALRSAAAQWLMTHGHEQEAIEWANLVLAADPSHPAMNRLLADYYRKNGQIGLADLHEARAQPH